MHIDHTRGLLFGVRKPVPIRDVRGDDVSRERNGERWDINVLGSVRHPDGSAYETVRLLRRHEHGHDIGRPAEHLVLVLHDGPVQQVGRGRPRARAQEIVHQQGAVHW